MKYRVWCDELHDGPEDGRVIEASGPYEAARKWAEWNDTNSGDYLILNGNALVVHVKWERSNTVDDYEVTGEPCPVYRARLVSANPALSRPPTAPQERDKPSGSA